MGRVLEVCVESAASALAAATGGADRVELCHDRAVGGVTPTDSESARAYVGLSIPVHVLIRPRAGDFDYSDDEFDTMRRQIIAARTCGAAGLVFGLLRPDGSIDRARTATLVDLAGPLAVTFHKAFDAAGDPFAALDELIGLGIGRVLTSGQAPTAREGLDLLAALVRQASGRIGVMAGGSITPDDLPALRRAGLDEVHVGSCVAPAGPTDPDLVRLLAARWRDTVITA